MEDTRRFVKKLLDDLLDREETKANFMEQIMFQFEKVEKDSFEEGKQQGILETKSKYAIVDDENSLPAYIKEKTEKENRNDD
jgi:hypothetical protein